MSTLSLSTNRTTMTSPTQSTSRQQISGLARMFKALSMSDKALWQQAANALNATNNRTGRHKLSAANAFSTVNSARIACQLPIITQPALPLVGPPVFPTLTLRASGSGASFALSIAASSAYGDAVVVQAAPPTIAGRTTYSHAAFKPVGALPGLLSGPSAITGLYTARYGTPENGSAIAVRLYGVSNSGLRSGDVIVTTVYLSTAAPSVADGDEDVLRAA